MVGLLWGVWGLIFTRILRQALGWHCPHLVTMRQHGHTSAAVCCCPAHLRSAGGIVPDACDWGRTALPPPAGFASPLPPDHHVDVPAHIWSWEWTGMDTIAYEVGDGRRDRDKGTIERKEHKCITYISLTYHLHHEEHRFRWGTGANTMVKA